jgi:sugar lactone lactonase YvrE
MASGKTLGPEFTYDLTELRKVDPNLVRFEETGSIATGLKASRDIALGADGRLWVAGDSTLRVFSAAGQLAVELKVAGEPQRLAFGHTGNIYVAMTDHVEVLAGDGRPLAAWAPAGPKSTLTGIAAAEKDVFVADAAAAAVLRYDTAGRLIRRIGEKDEARNIPGIVIPSPYFGVAVGPKDTLWVANTGRRRMECYSFDGDLKWWWGKASPKIEYFFGCCNPSFFTVLADGFFVTAEKGLPRVKVYKPTGELESVVAPPSAFDERAVGLAVAADATGRVFVLDPGAGKVRVFARKKSEAAK